MKYNIQLNKLTIKEIYDNAAISARLENKKAASEFMKEKCGFLPNTEIQVGNDLLIGYVEDRNELFDSNRFARLYKLN